MTRRARAGIARRWPGHVLGLALSFAFAGPACDTTYVFDGLDVGAADDTREPRARANSQFIRAIHADLLGRTPETYELVISFNGQEAFRFPIDEQDVLEGALAGIGDPLPMRALIAAGMVTSAEASIPDKSEVTDPDAFVREQFRRILGRNPNAYELDAFVREWHADAAVNPRTVIRALIGSREYQSF